VTLALLLALTLSVHAPASLGSAAARVRAVDRQDLARALLAAGLSAPDVVEVALIAEDDPIARETPSWVAGRASGDRYVVLFPARITRYPYDSLESVVRHEIVHLALYVSAGRQPLPRWFHEGVATSVDAGWGFVDEARLLLAALNEPTVEQVGALFRSESQPDTTLAYLLATALVNDLRERHGPDVAGRIAGRVAAGAPFSEAFARETGETPDGAAAIAWRAYRGWSRWIPAVASASAIWTLILGLALLAYLARRRRRAGLRRRWEEEDRFGG
jgi:hypothetical protein